MFAREIKLDLNESDQSIDLIFEGLDTVCDVYLVEINFYDTQLYTNLISYGRMERKSSAPTINFGFIALVSALLYVIAFQADIGSHLGQLK